MRPGYRIAVDGADLTDRFGRVLVSITVTDEAGVKADTAEIVVDGREGFAAPAIGAELEIWMGMEPEPVRLGKYTVDAWEKSFPVRTLMITAKSADLTGGFRASRTHSYHETTIREIVEDIAGRHGFKPVVGPDIGAREVPHIDQYAESNAAFLTRLASRNGATFKLTDGRLIFAAKGSRTLADGSDKPAIVIRPAQISHADASCDKRGDYKSARCEYMDAATKKRKSVKFGTGEPQFRDKRLYGSQAEAEAAAEAKLGELTRGQISVQIEMEGTPTLYAEALVRLEDFDEDVDGEYLAKSVVHSFSRSGYRTSLSVETEGNSSTEE